MAHEMNALGPMPGGLGLTFGHPKARDLNRLP